MTSRIVRVSGTNQVQVLTGVVTSVGRPGPPGPSGQIADTWSQAMVDSPLALTANLWTDVSFQTIVSDITWGLSGPDLFDAKETGTYVLTALIRLPAGTGTRRLRIVRLDPDGTAIVISQDEITATSSEPNALSTTITLRIPTDITLKVQAFSTVTTTIDTGAFTWSRVGTGPKGDPGPEGGLDLTQADGRYVNIAGDVVHGPLMINEVFGNPSTFDADIWFSGVNVDGRGLLPPGTTVSRWIATIGDDVFAEQDNPASQPSTLQGGGLVFAGSENLETTTTQPYQSQTFFITGAMGTASQHIFMVGNTSAELQFALGKTVSDAISLTWGPATGAIAVTSPPSVVIPDQTYVFAVAITWSATPSIKVYLNGTLRLTATSGSPAPVGSAPWWIGANPLSTTVDGKIFEISSVLGVQSDAFIADRSSALLKGFHQVTNYFTVNSTGSAVPILSVDESGAYVGQDPTVDEEIANKKYVDSKTGVTGLPTGGGVWDVLGKNSATNFDVKWRTLQIGPAASAPASLPDNSIYFGY